MADAEVSKVLTRDWIVQRSASAQARDEVKVRPYSARRLKELSTPKDSKASWWTTFEPIPIWGNQEHLWPIKSATLNAEATPRTQELAEPKIDYSIPGTVVPQFIFGCGRPSQIWTIPPPAMHARASKRVKQLAGHKVVNPQFLHQHIPHYVYGCGRMSAIWELNPGSLTCPSRPRTAKLARPKTMHPHWAPPKPAQSVVTEGAKLYEVTTHMENLARPKTHVEGPYRDAQWPVSKATKEATASERLQELAKPKKPAEGYTPCRSVIWKVGVGALNAVTSNRIEELAKPIIRDTMDHVQFNPDVFNVSEAAKKAKASPRIEELAEPIRRGN